jgi:hypothetical protein
VPEPQASEARRFAAAADAAYDSGEQQRGLALATRALLLRLGACQPPCPEAAESFIQLGDMRRRQGQLGWAAQSYRRALSIAEPHGEHANMLTRAARDRLMAACTSLASKQAKPTAACSP